MQSVTSVRKESSSASITANCSSNCTSNHFQVIFPLTQRSQKCPNGHLLDWLRQERQMNGEEEKGVAWEIGAEKRKIKNSSRIVSPIWGLSHHSFSCHLCTPMCLGSCPFLCQASLFYKTKWTACSWLLGKISAVTFKSTVFYRHDYHSPVALMWLVGVMTSYVPWTIKNCKKTRLPWGEKTEIATSDTTSVPPLF